MMRTLAWVLAAAVLAAAIGVGQQVRLLIVDETTTMEESLRVQALARGLRATGVFVVKAMLSLPTEPWTDEAFLFILVFPPQSAFVWLLSPGPAQYLPDPLPLVYAGLVDGATQAFGGVRQVRGSGDDLYPFLLSLQCQRVGLLMGAN